MHASTKRGFAAAGLFTVAVLTLSGCGVLKDTFEAMTDDDDNSTSESRDSGGSSYTSGDAKVVTVKITSDGATSGELSVELDTANDDQSYHEASVDLPFEREFSVALDAPFPLRSTHVEVEASPDATYIECSILLDGNEVASHRAEGGQARATCDRHLQLGPS